jgi:hypothetical protein
VVSVVDEDGQVLEADFTSSDVGAGISVKEDPNFLSLNNSQQIRRQARFFVKGSELTHTSFKVNALGLTKTIDVTSIPGVLDAEITDSQPELGDTVTITAPTGTFFTDTAFLAFEGTRPVVVSQDETTITFIPLPNTAGPGLVSFVGVESNPAVTFNLATAFNVTTDSILDIGAAISNTTPALGEAVTLTLPAGLKLIPESLQTLTVAGGPVFPRNRTLSADSSVITFTPPPNADSVVTVNGIVPGRLAACCDTVPGYTLQLSTAVKVTTPVIDTFPSTLNNATPALDEAVTLTSSDPGTFTINDTARVLIGGTPAIVTGRTANNITFQGPVGASGGLTVNGVNVAGFSLPLPSNAGTVTVDSTISPTPLSGTDAPGSAPALTVPAAGLSSVLYDAGSYDYQAPIFGGQFGNFPARLYKLTVPSDLDITVTLNWTSAEDLGAYWFLADGTTEPAEGVPADGVAPCCQPETSTSTLVGGTTYLLAIVNFSGTEPPFIGIQLDAATPAAE